MKIDFSIDTLHPMQEVGKPLEADTKLKKRFAFIVDVAEFCEYSFNHTEEETVKLFNDAAEMVLRKFIEDAKREAKHKDGKIL